MGQPVTVRWTNELVGAGGACLPHVLEAVDQTLHWANPPVRAEWAAGSEAAWLQYCQPSMRLKVSIIL